MEMEKSTKNQIEREGLRGYFSVIKWNSCHYENDASI